MFATQAASSWRPDQIYRNFNRSVDTRHLKTSVMNKRMNRRILRSLKSPRDHVLTQKRILRAQSVVESIVSGSQHVTAQRDAFARAREAAGESWWKDDAVARAHLALTQTLFRAQLVSFAYYVFAVAHTIERISEGRWLDKRYDSKLSRVSRALAKLEKAEPEANPEYARLTEEYENILDAKLWETFVEFGAEDVGVLWRDDRRIFGELRERGRRSVFHANEYSKALQDVVDQSYEDSVAVAAAGKYRSAVTLLGASLEGRLLLRCLRSKRRAVSVMESLPKKLRSRANSDVTKWTFEILVEVCTKAGWLPQVESDDGVYLPNGMAHSVRELRNWIHPAREASARPWQGVFKQDYEMVHALYLLVISALAKRRSSPCGA